MILVPVRPDGLAERALWAFRLLVGAPLLLVIGVVALLSGGNQLVALGLIGLPVALLVQEIRRR
jgi:hypothetical protein